MAANDRIVLTVTRRGDGVPSSRSTASIAAEGLGERSEHCLTRSTELDAGRVPRKQSTSSCRLQLANTLTDRAGSECELTRGLLHFSNTGDRDESL